MLADNKPQRATAVWLPQPLAVLALLLLTTLAYGNSFAGTWQFDDYAVLLDDPRVQSLSAWWQSLPHIRPLFKFSVALNHETAFGLLGFHLLNLVVHLANTWLVFALFDRLLATTLDAAAAQPLALLLAVVFAVHPAQTEAVSYLSGRSVSLAGFGVLLACWSFLSGRESGKRRWYLLTGVATLLAVAARETALVIPLLLWLFAAWLPSPSTSFTADNAERRSSSRRALMVVASMLMLLLALLCLARYRDLLWQALLWPDFASLLATQSQSLQHLLAVLFLLAPLNADPALIIAPLWSARGITAMGLVLSLLLLAWWLRRRRPLLSIGLLWAFICWLPTHTLLLRFDPVNDRQLYLAMPGLLLALISVLPLLRWRAALPVLTLIAGGVLAALTWQRNVVYHDEVQFWQAVLQQAPHNARAWNNLGVAYATSGDTAAADLALQQALQQRPGYLRAAVNLKLLRAGHRLR